MATARRRRDKPCTRDGSRGTVVSARPLETRPLHHVRKLTAAVKAAMA